MYPTSTEFRRVLEAGDISQDWYGTITMTDGETVDFSYENIAASTGTHTRKCSETSSIGMGTVYAAELSLQFKDGLGLDRRRLFDGIIDLNAKIVSRTSVSTWGDAGAFSWMDLSETAWEDLSSVYVEYVFPMGKYIIKQVMQTYGDVKIVAYDFMILFDAELPANVNRDGMLPYDRLQSACTACGVTLGISREEVLKMPNGNRMLAFANTSDQMKTWRDVVAETAEALGGNAMMTRGGALTVMHYGRYAVDGIGAGFRYSSEFSDYQSYYTGIYLTYKEGGVQDYRSNTTEQEDTGLSYDLGYNAFLQISNETRRHAAMTEIINAFRGLMYTPFKVSMPFNPAYDLMDVVEFYDNQADGDDVAPITAITVHIGGKMDISCGGENPALQDAVSKETRAVESISNGFSSHDFWMVMNNAPEENSLTVQADTPTKIGEVLFYAREDLSMIQIAYTATYTLEQTTLVEAEIFVDETSVYKTQENQLPEENRITVTTGYELSGKGSHKVEVYLTVTEATINVSGVLSANSASGTGE